MSTRRLLAVLTAGVLACSCAIRPPGSTRAASSPPRLAVVIAVDGLSWDRLQSARPWLTSGLKRLLDDGAVATQCRYEHLNTETGPGHASLATGAPPRVHGIPLNQWYSVSPDGAGMATIYSAAQPLSGEPEASAKTMPGPGRLRVPTLGDRLAAHDPRAKVVAISNKDRAAIFMAGRDPRHAVYWYQSVRGTYVTSAAYDSGAPGPAAAARVVARFNADKAGEKLADHLGTKWRRMPAPDRPHASGFESGLETFQDATVGTGFPKDLTKSKRALPSAILWTPLADRLLSDLALDLLADDALALGRDDVPDILSVSYSANDYVAHFYGPESEEDLELLRALDVEIGRLLDDLTARFGKRGGVLVAFSADHGFLPLPEATHRSDPRAPGARVADTKIVDGLNAAVDAKLKLDPASHLVYRLEGCSLWLDRAALARPGAPSAGEVLEVVESEMATTWKDVVLRTLDLDEATRDASGDEIDRQARNAYVPGRSGDLFVVPRFGVLIDPYGGKGSSHGTPWDYDTHVPMIFWGPGIAAGVIATPSTPCDLAPTLGAWLGVDLPDATGAPIAVWDSPRMRLR